MNCQVTNLDLCQLKQETFHSPTFNFGDIDVSDDQFIFSTFKSFGSAKKEHPVNWVDENTVYIESLNLPLGDYFHELIWMHGTQRDVVVQGRLKVTDKGNDCGCEPKNNYEIKVVTSETTVNVNYSERVIERITDKGPQGDSAYQVAVENGFVGTESEWLESLKGEQGEQGNPFTYDDFTPEQIEDLKRPAIEAAESVLIVENQISINEQGRVQAENERETAESLRVEAETLRQTSTQEAISNAENATENANTAAQNANDARLAIQDDLALKADQADLDQLESDVEQLAYVKIKNEAVNGNFENGLIAPFSQTEGFGGASTLSINSSTPISGNYDIRLTIITPTTVPGRPAFRGLQRDGNIGDKIYLHFYAKILSGIPAIWSMGAGGPASQIYAGDVINGRNIRVIDVVGTDSVGLIYFNSMSAWDMQMDNFMRINLTETFGAGNEPTEEEMNSLISTLGIDYFEGEITIPAQKIMQWQLKLIRKNKNAIIALGGTII